MCYTRSCLGEYQTGRQPQPPIERPSEVHLHLHGVTAEDIAAILNRREDP